MHQTLQRQIKKAFGDQVPHISGWDSFVESISKTYEHFDEDRTLLERSLELSSREMTELNEKIRIEKEGVEEVVRQRTAQLVAERSYLITSINSIPFGVLLVDSHGTIIVKNDLVASILSIQSNYYGLPEVVKVLPPDLDIAEKCKQCVEKKERIELKEVQLGSKSVRILLSPIIGSDHQSLGHVFLIEDITEAKILERSRDEFFSIASHELRTPLTAIKGNASLLNEFYVPKIDDNEVKQMIGDMITASDRLIKIVNDFLDVSRLEQKRIKFAQLPLNINEVIAEAVKELKNLAINKGIELQAISSENLPLIGSDKDRVKQVIFNLIANALNYTEKGHVTIGVKQEDDSLKVFVEDTGAGISVQNQSLLFHKFQQAGDSIITRDVTQGTGLGLYICKLIVEALGGTIGLEKSEPGKGSIFYFKLPVHKD